MTTEGGEFVIWLGPAIACVALAIKYGIPLSDFFNLASLIPVAIVLIGLVHRSRPPC